MATKMNQDAGLSFGLLLAVPQMEMPAGTNEEEHIMEEQIQSMTEEAAYYLAEKRGFEAGYELEDWLQAKRQVDDQLKDLIKHGKKRGKPKSKK